MVAWDLWYSLSGLLILLLFFFFLTDGYYFDEHEVPGYNILSSTWWKNYARVRGIKNGPREKSTASFIHASVDTNHGFRTAAWSYSCITNYHRASELKSSDSPFKTFIRRHILVRKKQGRLTLYADIQEVMNLFLVNSLKNTSIKVD